MEKRITTPQIRRNRLQYSCKVCFIKRQTPLNVSDKRKKKKAHSKMTELHAPMIPPWNKVMADNKSNQSMSKTAKRLDFFGLKVIKPLNNIFTTEVYCRKYCSMNNSS